MLALFIDTEAFQLSSCERQVILINSIFNKCGNTNNVNDIL